jgi:hypothetical protein
LAGLIPGEANSVGLYAVLQCLPANFMVEFRTWHLDAPLMKVAHPQHGMLALLFVTGNMRRILFSLLRLLLCSCYRGYVGTWTTFDMQHNDCCDASSSDAAPPRAAPAARVTPKHVDETVNLRLFRLEDAATMEYCQVT